MTILETIPIIEQTGKYVPFLVWGFALSVIFLYLAAWARMNFMIGFLYLHQFFL